MKSTAELLSDIRAYRAKWSAKLEDYPAEGVKANNWALAVWTFNTYSDHIKDALNEGDLLAWDLCKAFIPQDGVQQEPNTSRAQVLSEAQAAFEVLANLCAREIRGRNDALAKLFIF